MPKAPGKRKAKANPAAKPKRKGAAIARRRQALAEAAIAGESVKSIARREGVSRSHLSRELHSKEVQFIIARMLGRHRTRMTRLVAKSLKAVEESFHAQRYNVDRDGDPVDCGPDHFARLSGVQRTFDILKLAQPKDEQIDPGTITWEAFLHIYKERAAK